MKKARAKAKKSGRSPIRVLADDVWEFTMREAPSWATFLGDRRHEHRLEERGPEARERRLSAAKGFLARLKKAPTARLDEEDAITRAVIERTMGESVESFEHCGWEWEFNQLNGLHIELQDLLQFHPKHDEKGVEHLIARLEAAPAAFLQLKGDLRDGLASGRVLPRVAYDRCVAQFRAFLAQDAAETPFGKTAASLPKSLPGTARARLSASMTAAVRGKVIPAYRDFAVFLETEYAGKARAEVGVHAIPGGRDAYAFAVRTQTTTDLSPEEIHRVGNEELEKNKGEMLAIARRHGHRGDLRSYLDGLMKDPQYRLKTREQILDRYRAILKKMDKALPGVFALLPKTAYRVEAMPAYKEKDSPAAYYYPPTDDGKRPGIFFACLHDPPSWPTYDMECLAYHEAVPGHHLQVAVAMERRNLPSLRRNSFYTAYVEGWAHYSERLAEEMGMYSSDVDRVGMLAAQAWRAARLVVDTGMHFHAWPRERAVEVLRSIKTGPESETGNEIDRYIVWPGQALAYKVGHRKIAELREGAKGALGGNFDLRSFHDEILKHGALPLAVLEQVVARWVEARKRAG
jgi:uncharacterized protein (DUF885 family)